MAKKVSYLDNLAKEIGQTASAWKKSFNASADYNPGADARAINANRKYNAQKGQVLGALLQGRRYDDKTNKQIKAKKK
jgi:hypothetical protein